MTTDTPQATDIPAGYAPEAQLDFTMTDPCFHTPQRGKDSDHCCTVGGIDRQLSELRHDLRACFSEVNPTASPSWLSDESRHTCSSLRKIVLQQSVLNIYGGQLQRDADSITIHTESSGGRHLDFSAPVDNSIHIELPAHLEAAYTVPKPFARAGKDLSPKKGSYGGVLKRKLLERKLPSSPLAVRRSIR